MKNTENTNRGMSQNLYQVIKLNEQSFFQKLFRQLPEENAVIELNNLLATKDIKDISAINIIDIEKRYGLRLNKEFRLNLEEFYAVYFNFCLSDITLSQEETQSLNHLKTLFSLDEPTVNNLHNRIGLNVYKRVFEEAIIDGDLTKKEDDLLRKLETELKLPRHSIEKISNEAKINYIQRYSESITESLNFSPEKENEFNNILKNLDIKVSVIKQETKKQLKQLKTYWDLENLPLPIIQPDIALQKSEECFLSVPNVNWFELRHKGQDLKPINIDQIKKLYIAPEPNTKKGHNNPMKLIDSGTLYLTNKRVILTGDKKDYNLRLDKIINLIPYVNAIEVNKEAGKDLFLQFNNMNGDMFSIVLERLFRDLNN